MVFKKKGESESIESGTEAWNVAKGFTIFKILQHMINCDDLETISIYGSKDINEIMPKEIRTQKRIDAIHRYKDELIQIIDNSYFALSNQDKELVDDFREQLLNLGTKYLEGISTKQVNMVAGTNEMKINEPFFYECLNVLRKIKRNINMPLDRANLIFKGSEEIDFESMKQEIFEGG